jgi:hypothetical protein
MITALAFGFFLILTTAIAWFTFFGQGKILKTRTRRRLLPGESVAFESPANKSSTGWTVMFSHREGYVVVTDERLLFGSWGWPPFWPSVRENLLTEIDRISVIRIFGVTQVQISVHGKTLMLTPKGGAFIPFSNQRTQQFVLALEAGSGRVPEANDLGPHIRKHVGQ